MSVKTRSVKLIFPVSMFPKLEREILICLEKFYNVIFRFFFLKYLIRS